MCVCVIASTLKSVRVAEMAFVSFNRFKQFPSGHMQSLFCPSFHASIPLSGAGCLGQLRAWRDNTQYMTCIRADSNSSHKGNRHHRPVVLVKTFAAAPPHSALLDALNYLSSKTKIH